MRPQTPSLSDVISGAIDIRLEDLHTAMPAKVTAYDRTTQSISAQPLIKQGTLNEEGDRQVTAYPVITHVPVCFPGSGGFSITWPIAVGDIVLLVFASGSLDKWLSVGGHVDPNDDRRHNLSDAIAIPGLRPFSGAIDGLSSTHMEIQAAPGAEIRIGGSNAFITRDEFLAHGHATAGTGTPSGPTTAGVTPGVPSEFPGTQVLKGG